LAFAIKKSLVDIKSYLNWNTGMENDAIFSQKIIKDESSYPLDILNSKN